ncbi:uncharacterized protein PV09_03277 [Verruconis gallopava]|uniref:RTA1-domain-containing protein n=1 Tax=Verruconis gallopava TaxID=253628 RepID=A0A0D2AHR9_9PEZI|nr:uncharacterized protein PV09_03277 [Verruconis gallopava]KIW06110.1 hypothetical protein PV09_03277 [Verruconis gallopava]
MANLYARAGALRCKEVSPSCPVENSIYGYAPSLVWSALFLGIFAVSTIAHTVQGIRYKTWSFMIAMTIGGLCEAVGEIGRLMMHRNPFSDVGFKIQIILLTFAPAFLAAGIYLQLKHLVLTFGAEWSVLRPSLYTWIFIICDIFSIALQGAGGGIAATVQVTNSLFNVGNNITIAGLAFQVFTLLVFGMLALEYLFRTVKTHKHELNPATSTLRRTLKFKLFLCAIILAYTTILIRCVYRVAELAGGWSRKNQILRDETLFLALDSFMVSIAIVGFNLFHPGACFDFKKLGGAAQEKRDTTPSEEQMSSQTQ